jgi:enamine deaminase RidA (YjgF/YER057c/UK114 family)
VFVSGCLGFDPKTGTFVEGGVEAQTRQALQNLKSIVESSGSQVGKIVKTTVRDRPAQIGLAQETFDKNVLV